MNTAELLSWIDSSIHTVDLTGTADTKRGLELARSLVKMADLKTRTSDPYTLDNLAPGSAIATAADPTIKPCATDWPTLWQKWEDGLWHSLGKNGPSAYTSDRVLRACAAGEVVVLHNATEAGGDSHSQAARDWVLDVVLWAADRSGLASSEACDLPVGSEEWQASDAAAAALLIRLVEMP